MDDITALLKGRNKELEMAGKVGRKDTAVRAAGSRMLTEPCTDTATNILLVQEEGPLGMGGAPRTEHTDAVSATSLTFT